MARHKNVNWRLPEGTPDGKGFTVHNREDIQISLLMDLRDELQRLNTLMHCHNTTGIPHTLKRIDKRLATRFSLTHARKKR